MHSLLEFEEKYEVLNYRFSYKNTLIWPYVRFILFRKAEMIDMEVSTKLEKDNRTSLQKILDNIYRYLFKNSILYRNNDILILSSNSSKIINCKGRYEDRLFDYYANIYPQNTLIMESNNYPIKNYKRGYPKVVYDDLLNIACSKIKNKDVSEEDIGTINSLIILLKENFPVKMNYQFYSELRMIMIEYCKQLDIIERSYYKFIKKINPKIVIIEDGCYGGERTFIIKMLNDLKITTVELQHGLIHTEHWAYNYSPQLINSSEYKKYMPQYLLMFGEFWLDKASVPIKKEVIGNQNFNLFNNCISEINERTILFVATLEHTSYLKYIGELLANKKFRHKIILKLHPLDVKNGCLYKKFMKYSNFKLILNGNIYDYLSKVNIVIGDSSTTLYEAHALGKKVIVLNNHRSNRYMSKDIGIWINNSMELISYLNDNTVCTSSVDSDYYFNRNCEKNYKKFVKKIIRKN